MQHELSDRHAAFFAAGLVNTCHYFQGVQTGFAGNERLSAILACVAEVEELALEGSQWNGHGVGGARHHLLFHWGGLACVVLDIPHSQLVASDDCRTLCPMDLDAL